MNINLPKTMKGWHFDKIFSVEMNDFDVEGLFPAIFYLIRSGGKQRGKRLDATEIDKHVSSFVEHKCIDGFEGEEGRRLADKWIRTSLIRTARVGRGQQKGEQILFIRPLSFLSYKPGFPAEVRRLRGVPQFFYQIFHKQFGEHRTSALTGLERLMIDAFSEGITLPDRRELDGYYDGQAQLDTEVLASLYYLDTFESCPASLRREKDPAPALLRNAAEVLAKDIACFMLAYRWRVPPGVLAQYLVALLNFELAIYTLKLVHATNTLVKTGKLSKEMASVSREDGRFTPTDLEFYVDVTGHRDLPSGQMAHASVNRDLEALQEFFGARLTLRTLDRYAEHIPSLQRELPSPESVTYFETLLTYCENPYIQARAAIELEEIRRELEGDVGEDEELLAGLSPEIQAIFQDERLDAFSKVMRILELSQRSKAVSNSVSWYWSVCGLKRDDGFLEGNLRGRRIWRYYMSDSLLEVLVQLCTVLPEYSGARLNQHASAHEQLNPRQVTIVRFLKFLRDRYGILIDQPPEWLRNTENIAGAKQNFEALKRRLRQMGLFLDLSDDFNAQRIRPRYTKILDEDD